ncbi:lipopolysaccharide biosynthesis protein [Methanosarcina sp. T3]|uniref:lipopolysaccharide biosynthesis protein n=1 Tax=Methanosarcina sp. T3 TaxID=3439062 RepID=UPI003F87795F
MASKSVEFEQDPLTLQKNKFVNVYRILFAKKMNADIKNFFKNISYVTAGTAIEAISWFMFNVLSGRFLGPNEYGKFTLIYSVGMFLYLPMTLGISTGIIKYSSEKIDFNRQRNIITTSYTIVLIISILCISIYIKFSTALKEVFLVSQNILNLGIIFAIVYTFYIITTSTLQGTFQIRKYATLKPICGLIILTSFLVFVLCGNFSFKSPILSMYLAYLVTGGIILLSIRRYLSFQSFDFEWAKIITKYGTFSFLSAVSYIVCTNVDKILINKYLTTEAVGLFNAYFISSLKIMSMVSGILITVLFPLISGHKEKNFILNKYKSLIPYIILFGIPLMILTQVITLKFYGDSFELNLRLVLIFSITSVLFLWYDIYGWIFNSMGIKGAKLTMYGTIMIAIADIILDIYLIPPLGLEGSIIATAISYCIGLMFFYIKRSYNTHLPEQL